MLAPLRGRVALLRMHSLDSWMKMVHPATVLREAAEQLYYPAFWGAVGSMGRHWESTFTSSDGPLSRERGVTVVG